MQRILDLDLDFFQHNVEYLKNLDGERLDSAHYPPWQHDEAVSFLERQCGLSRDDPLPGASVEHHGEVFFVWRELIASGVLSTPFEIVHVDAHADLGWEMPATHTSYLS